MQPNNQPSSPDNQSASSELPISPPANTNVGQVVVGGFDPTAVAQPVTPLSAVNNQPQTPGTEPMPTPAVANPPKRHQPSRRILAGISVVGLLLAGIGFYFGYYTNPATIYSQGLTNTGKGYDKLINYSEEQSKQDYKGYTVDGSYSFDQEGGDADGSFSAKAYGQDGEYKIDLGYSGLRIDAEVRTIASKASTPDMYVKANGLNGIGSLLGSSQLDTALQGMNNQWIFIDHTLFDSLTKAASGGAEEPKVPSEAEIIDYLRAFGTVNKEYVYTTNADKAVLRVIDKKGKESFNNRTAYRYTVGFNNSNVQKYVAAQKQALLKSKLGAWVKKNGYEKEVSQAFDDASKDAANIKSDTTFDLWIDTSRRITYKVRIPESVKADKNYVDLGLDYTGGDSYPFFAAVKSDGADFKLVAKLNTKDSSLSFDANLKDSGSAGTFKLKLDAKPNNDRVKVAKPESAKTLAQVWQELGLGDLNQQLEGLEQNLPAAIPDDQAMVL